MIHFIRNSIKILEFIESYKIQISLCIRIVDIEIMSKIMIDLDRIYKHGHTTMKKNNIN